MTKVKFSVNDKVFWNDPDESLSSGIYKVTKIVNEEVIVIDNGFSEAEVYPHELELLERG